MQRRLFKYFLMTFQRYYLFLIARYFRPTPSITRSVKFVAWRHLAAEASGSFIISLGRFIDLWRGDINKATLRPCRRNTSARVSETTDTAHR